MYRRIALALVLLLPALASAADWRVIASTKLGDLMLDAASVKQEGKFTGAVVAYQFKSLQRLNAPPHTVFNMRQDNLLVDCAHPTLGIRASRFFEDEKLGKTYKIDPDRVKFKPVKPDTMAEKVLNAVCAAAPKAKP